MTRTTTIALGLALALAAPAQEGKKQARAPVSFEFFDLDFAGGTLGDLLQVLDKKLRERPNFLATRAAAAMKVPAMKLHHVNLANLFDVLPGFMENQPSGEERGRIRIEMEPNKPGPTIYAFYKRISGPRNISNTIRTQVFNVTELLEGEIRIEDVVTAIETAWDLAGEKKRPVLKYHKETRLLLAKGSMNGLKLVSDVIRQLQSTSRLEREMKRLQEENNKLKQHIMELRAKLGEAGKGK